MKKDILKEKNISHSRYLRQGIKCLLKRKAGLNNVIHRLSLLFLQRPNDRGQKGCLSSGMREIRGLEGKTAESEREEKEG